MSQKYKSFSKGRTPDLGSALPPGVKRVGYLRKLKKMKKRFFVLYMESNYGVARLEYYSSEKKWKFGCEPRRCIELKSCLNISRKLHSKQKNVIALFTRDDCFSIVADTAEELEGWLKDILEAHKNAVDVDENSKKRIVYEHLWQVVIDKHDLEYEILGGSYRVALTPKSLYLIKMTPLEESNFLEFPLMSIRRCGHSKDHFFIELGRSAITGAGEIYMATEGTIVAQNMHETVLSAMKSSKIREDPIPRPRSASSSENSNPISTSRPIGVVAPQTVSSTKSGSFSSSRERCDSLPTRPQTIMGNSNHFTVSSLSSPYTSSGNLSRETNSRPHSMYEWPSANSPVMRNSMFSPSSLSGGNSSTEEINSYRHLSLNYYPHYLISNGSLHSPSSRSTAETKDDYLKMSPNAENTTNPFDYMSMKRSSETIKTSASYMDMKAQNDCSRAGSLKKSAPSYMPMAPGGVSNEVPVVMQAGYLDMSPTSSLPNSALNSSSLEKLSNFQLNQRNEAENSKSFELEKVASLLQVEENKIKIVANPAFKNKPSVIINDVSNGISNSQSKSCTESSPSSNRNISNIDEATGSRPPIPDRTYIKNENKSNVCPPLPARKQINSSSIEHNKIVFQNVKDVDTRKESKILILKEEESNSKIFQNDSTSENVLQNTNLSRLSNSEKNVTSGSFCSNMKPSTASDRIKTEAVGSSTADVNENSNSDCDNLNLRLECDAVGVAISSNDEGLRKESSTLSDYMNINLEKSDCSMTFKHVSSGSITQKNTHFTSPSVYPSDPNYSNVQFGKPFCPLPNPNLSFSEKMKQLAFSNTLKCDGNPQLCNPGLGSTSKCEDLKAQKPPIGSSCGTEQPKNTTFTPKFRNIPNTLPAFRKQMSAPAGPLSLRPELPSPGRKSSCPVTASASMVKPPTSPAFVASVHPMHLQSHGTAHLKVSASKSPDHSSVSSISSASDEISSTHSSPKTMNTSHNFNVIGQPTVADSQYENVVIPQKASGNSRPPSVSSEKELNYASLDLAPSTREVPRSPTLLKPPKQEEEEPLTYAEIDFTKSEGLKNVSGSLRDGRL